MGNRKKQRNTRPSPGRRKMETRSLSAFVIPLVVFLVVVVVVGGVLVSSGSQRAQSAAAPAGNSVPLVTVPPLATQPIPYSEVPRASLQETVEKLEQGQAILVDVRSKSSYDKAHAVGALSIPEEEIDTRLGELPRDKELILYCS